MAEFHLEFEKPIIEIKKQIQGLIELSSSNPDIDIADTISALERKLDSTLKEIYSKLTAWQRVQLARHPERPYTLDYINQMCSDFVELHGDRRFSDDKAVVGGFARLDGRKVMVIGTQKGRDMKSNVMRNFGWPHPEGYRKATRLMKMAELAQVPIITFIDTPGAFPGIASEERHIGEAIAVSMRDMFTLTVPVIAVIIGEGGSGGAIGIGVGNRILILENAYYSVITPEGCAAILWKDRRFAPQAAEALNLTAQKLLELGIADAIVPEPLGGAHCDSDKMAGTLKEALIRQLDELGTCSADELRNQRYEKFRAMGRFAEPEAETDEPETNEAADEQLDSADCPAGN